MFRKIVFPQLQLLQRFLNCLKINLAAVFNTKIYLSYLMEILDWVKKQTGKIADNVKDYKFYVKHEPQFIDSSTTLTLTSFANRDEVATIPCFYKWSKIKNGLTTQVPEFKGNSFICQPSDVGSIIQAEITSTDPHHPGTAILKFGPVKFDVMIKKQIQHSLAAKSATFNVDLVQKQDRKQCQVRINDQTIKISHSHSNIQYTFDYNLNQPRIQASLRAPNKISINFNEKHQNQVKKFINQLFGFQDMTASLKASNQHRLQIQFPSRAAKDKFLFVHKAYNTRKALRHSTVLQKLENLDFNQQSNFNLILQIQSLKSDLVKMNKLNEKSLLDKKMYHSEARKLQKEIQQIIVTYTKIAEGKCETRNQLDQSVMELRQKKDEVMERKMHALMNQNQALRDRIDFLSAELDGRNHEPGMIKSHSDQPLQHSRGGFIKKRQVEEVPANNHFNAILENLNESEIKESSPSDSQIKVLNQEKLLLAKKLNQSVMKIAKLQKQLNNQKMNHTTINVLSAHHEESMDRKMNATAFDLGDDRNKVFVELEQLKKVNHKLLSQNKKLKSEIPIVSSQQHKDNISYRMSGRKSQSSILGTSQRQPNPQMQQQSMDKLKNRIKQLERENQQLKDQIQMLNIQKELLQKEKNTIEGKYKKKMGQLMNENSMYRRNQDALNRSQNLSMQMDLYNQQQTNLLKEQNQILSKENERLSKICDKYVLEVKQVPKLKDEILQLKTQMSKRNNGHNDSISREQLLLDNV